MSQCLFPFMATRGVYFKQEDRQVPVPCGRCPECLKRRASMWSMRLKKEGERSTTTSFVTLTYDSRFVPISPNGFMTLKKRDIQLFFKRIRKANPDYRVRYYCAGEYGTERKRPHYHIIMFNAPPELDIAKAWFDIESNQPIGDIHFGKVSGASIGYTVKYINKGRWQPMHKNDDRVPEFSLMSKGLGSNYLTPQMINYHLEDLSRAFVTLEGGMRISIPRYYRDKLMPVNFNDKIIEQTPLLIHHIEDNKRLREKQNKIVSAAIEEAERLKNLYEFRTEYEKFESKRQKITDFNAKQLKRKDL